MERSHWEQFFQLDILSPLVARSPVLSLVASHDDNLFCVLYVVAGQSGLYVGTSLKLSLCFKENLWWKKFITVVG